MVAHSGHTGSLHAQLIQRPTGHANRDLENWIERFLGGRGGKRGLFSKNRQQHTQFPPTFYAVVANGRSIVVGFNGEDQVCPKFCEAVLDEEVLCATPFPSSPALGRVVSI